MIRWYIYENSKFSSNYFEQPFKIPVAHEFEEVRLASSPGTIRVLTNSTFVATKVRPLARSRTILSNQVCQATCLLASQSSSAKSPLSIMHLPHQDSFWQCFTNCPQRWSIIKVCTIVSISYFYVWGVSSWSAHHIIALEFRRSRALGRVLGSVHRDLSIPTAQMDQFGIWRCERSQVNADYWPSSPFLLHVAYGVCRIGFAITMVYNAKPSGKGQVYWKIA